MEKTSFRSTLIQVLRTTYSQLSAVFAAFIQLWSEGNKYSISNIIYGVANHMSMICICIRNNWGTYRVSDRIARLILCLALVVSLTSM